MPETGGKPRPRGGAPAARRGGTGVGRGAGATARGVRRRVAVDDKDFQDMLLTEVNEEEAGELLGTGAPTDDWQEPEWPEPEEDRE